MKFNSSLWHFYYIKLKQILCNPKYSTFQQQPGDYTQPIYILLSYNMAAYTALFGAPPLINLANPINIPVSPPAVLWRQFTVPVQCSQCGNQHQDHYPITSSMAIPKCVSCFRPTVDAITLFQRIIRNRYVGRF